MTTGPLAILAMAVLTLSPTGMGVPATLPKSEVDRFRVAKTVPRTWGSSDARACSARAEATPTFASA